MSATPGCRAPRPAASGSACSPSRLINPTHTFCPNRARRLSRNPYPYIHACTRIRRESSVARRLALTRELLGLPEKEFAEWAGVALSRYHLWETGRIPISLSSAIALCAAHGLTLDWLYRGKITGLPLWLALEVEACSAMSDAEAEFHNEGGHPEDVRSRLTRVLERRPEAAEDAPRARRGRLRAEMGGDIRKRAR
jgi:transcriptional regulator with XRE-family HTH domain